MSDTLKSFLKYASENTGLPETEIKDLLREKYGTFNVSKKSQYMEYLNGQKLVQFIEQEETKEPDHLCPYHNVRTRGTHIWYGRYTKTPSWDCPIGGESCFIHWKADTIAERKGWKKIDWDYIIGNWERLTRAEETNV